MKVKALVLAVVALLPVAASAHQAGDFFMRAGSATVRPTGGSDNVLGLGEFDVSNNTQLGLTFTYMATDNIGIELLGATPFRHSAIRSAWVLPGRWLPFISCRQR
jgi:outer membrane protein